MLMQILDCVALVLNKNDKINSSYQALFLLAMILSTFRALF